MSNFEPDNEYEYPRLEDALLADNTMKEEAGPNDPMLRRLGFPTGWLLLGMIFAVIAFGIFSQKGSKSRDWSNVLVSVREAANQSSDVFNRSKQYSARAQSMLRSYESRHGSGAPLASRQILDFVALQLEWTQNKSFSERSKSKISEIAKAVPDSGSKGGAEVSESLRPLAEAYLWLAMPKEKRPKNRPWLKDIQKIDKAGSKSFLEESDTKSNLAVLRKIAQTHLDLGGKDESKPSVLLIGMLLVLGMVLSLLMWVLYFGFGKDVLPPAGMPMGPLSNFIADRMALRAASIAGLFLVLSIAAGGLPDLMGEIVVAVFMIGFIAIGPADPLAPKHVSRKGLGLESAGFFKNAGLGIAGYLMNVTILLIALTAIVWVAPFLPPSGHPSSDALRMDNSFEKILATFIGAAVVAPIWEEVMFRGLLFPAFSHVTRSPIWGALISSFLFGAIHPQGLAGLLPLMAIALMNCWITYKTRSVLPAIVLHSIHNSVVLFIALVL